MTYKLTYEKSVICLLPTDHRYQSVNVTLPPVKCCKTPPETREALNMTLRHHQIYVPAMIRGHLHYSQKHGGLLPPKSNLKNCLASDELQTTI